jgi:hypothetical protein
LICAVSGISLSYSRSYLKVQRLGRRKVAQT